MPEWRRLGDELIDEAAPPVPGEPAFDALLPRPRRRHKATRRTTPTAPTGRTTTVLDKLPAWARHLVIVAGGTFLGREVVAILDAQGVTDVDWPAALLAGVNLAAVSTASAAAALFGLPLTRQYGVGAATSDTPPTA